MSITRIDTIAAQSGTFIVNNTVEKTVNSQAIIVLVVVIILLVKRFKIIILL